MQTSKERLQEHNRIIEQVQVLVNSLPDTGTVVEELTVTENGTYEPPEGVDGYSPVTVAVPEKEPVLEELSVTENGTYPVPENADGFGTVTVNVPDVPAVTQEITITENGEYTAPDGIDGYDKINVNVPDRVLNLQEKSITPGKNGQDVVFDAGYDGLSKVSVAGDENLVPENIVSGKSIFGVRGNVETGGSGSVPVCSITYHVIDITGEYKITIQRYVNGEFRTETIRGGSEEVTIDNVICGSVFFAQYNGNPIEVAVSGGVLAVLEIYDEEDGVSPESPEYWQMVFTAPGIAGAVGRIEVLED